MSPLLNVWVGGLPMQHTARATALPRFLEASHVASCRASSRDRLCGGAGADREVAAGLEGVRAGGDARPGGQRGHHLLHRERGPHGRPHRRLHHHRPRPGAPLLVMFISIQHTCVAFSTVSIRLGCLPSIAALKSSETSHFASVCSILQISCPL